MKDLLIPLAHLLTAVAKLMGPGDANTVFADNRLMKQRLLVMSRTRERAPTRNTLDRLLLVYQPLLQRTPHACCIWRRRTRREI